MSGQSDIKSLALIFRALAFAAEKHRNQRRKNAEASPYINHPIALVNVLCNEGGITDVSVLCAALLHDTIEDTQTTPKELEENFGADICGIVQEVTDDKNLDKELRKQLQIEHAKSTSYQGRLVKLADKICNLQDLANTPPPEWSHERRGLYFEWAKQVVNQLRGTHAKLEAVFDEAYLKKPV